MPLAGLQGDADAARRANIIAEKMPADEVGTAQRPGAGLEPVASSEKANVVAVNDPRWNSEAPGAAAQSAPQPPAPQIVPVPESAPADPVLEAQKLLDQLGFNVGEPDGTLGTKTKNAIRLFQLQSGLEVTGEVTPELLDAMRAKSS